VADATLESSAIEGSPRPSSVTMADAPWGTPAAGRALRHIPAFFWVLLDWAVIALATAVFFTAFVAGTDAFRWIVGPWVSGLAFGLCFTVAGLIFGLYEHRALLSRSRVLVRTGLTLGLGSILAFATIHVFFYSTSTRWLGLAVIAAQLLIALPLRLLAFQLIAASRLNVLCVGTAASVRQLVSLIHHAYRANYRIAGHVLVAAEPFSPLATSSRFIPGSRLENDRFFPYLCPCVGTLDQLGVIVADGRIDQVVVDAKLADDPDVGAAMLACLEQGCRVTDQSTFTERLLGEVPAAAIGTQWFVLADVAPATAYDVVKRSVDVACSLIGLALTLPVWPLIMGLIKLESPGAALYSQPRVGLNGRVFNIYKFRTMTADAERHGAQWAVRNDRRVTRFGRFLRKTRIDEVPQFWNILRGDMSIVGPRPERPEFVDRLANEIPNYRQRHLIKPGLTGWAQINYRYGASVDDAQRKLCFDLYYLKHRALELDLGIIIRTVGTFVSGAR
jgi:exopolysaccharide biosynthesis polyprenyl glycosylphosphotransferase